MKISDVKTILVGDPSSLISCAEGEFLSSPLGIFPDHKTLLPSNAVGLRGGPIYAVIVKVETDEGVYGLGSVGVGNGSAAYIIEHHLKGIVVGESPFDVESLWEKMFRSTLNYGRKGVALEAISGIDIALWDIMGKVTNQPVYNLLGGRTRDQIKVYASRLYANHDLNALASQAEFYLKQGFTVMKQRFGYGPRDGRAGMRKNLELVTTVRSVIGPDVELAADAYMGWDVDYAIRMIRMLEDAGTNLGWVEEPIIPDDVDGYARIRRSVRTPISGGEHEFTRYGFRELISKEAVDILQPDINRVGGMTEARKIWALAASNNLKVIPHAGQLHNYHMVIANLCSPLAEYFPPSSGGGVLDDDTLFWELFLGEPLAVGGYVELPNAPGFGWELNEMKIRDLTAQGGGRNLRVAGI